MKGLVCQPPFSGRPGTEWANPFGLEYCIAHNPLLFQLLGHWFTFIYRKCEHLAVGSSGRGLTRSRGHPHFVVASPSPVVPLLYHTLRGLSRGFSEISEIFSGVGRVHFCGSIPIPTQRSRPTPWTGLLPRPLTMIVYHRPHQKSRTFLKKFS